jgi:hypothetical protein
VRRDGQALEISSTTAPEDVERVARALLAGDVLPYTPRRRIDRFIPSPIRYWSSGALALLALSLAMAFIPLAVSSLVVFAVGSAATAGASLYCARRAGGILGPVAVGLAIPLLIAAYAIAFGVAMLGRNPAVSTHAGRHLVDPLMLSFAVATTAGFLDFGLKHYWIRIVAYSEMLFVVSVAGGSAYTLARGTWARLRELLTPRGWTGLEVGDP